MEDTMTRVIDAQCMTLSVAVWLVHDFPIGAYGCILVTLFRSVHVNATIRNHDSFDVDNPFDSIFVRMNLLVLVWNMLLDSFPYLDYLKLDLCYLLPISLPELFVSSHGGSIWMHPRFGEGVVISCFCVHFSLIAYSLSHGGTMTMSLMHQWHDTICGGVISPRRSLLYGAYGCILGSVWMHPRFGEGVVISCFCVHFSLIAYSLSSSAFSFPAAEVTLVDETQEMNDDNLMFDTGVLEEQEIEFEKVVEEPVVSVATTTKSIPVSAAEVVTTASASVEIPDELTLAQTLIEIKTAKPKPVTTAATTVTSVRPRAKGIIFHDQEEQVPASTKTFSSSQSQLPQVKDKGKGKMVEPEVPLKKKDQVALDEEMARNLEAQLQAELIEEERLARQKEEEANIALIESWDNTQAMMEADFELAQRLQAEEQGEITIEERSRLFVELMNRRKKHFAKLRAEEIRRNPPTKAQKRNQMSTYLKNMAGYKHSQLKSKSYNEIQKLFDKEMKRVNTFMDMNSEVVKGSETRTEESSKRVRDKLESDMSKKQKIDEHIDKDGRMRYFKLIRADGSSKRYSSMIKMFQGINREDLETLWKLVKAKHKNTRPEEDYERVLWGDLKSTEAAERRPKSSLNDLEIVALHIDGQSIDVDAPPDIIDVVDEDDDIIDEKDPIPHDLADFDDEDLVNLDIDDGVNVVYSSEEED
ncbi:ribonuclease H-like domain, reverse transcriptase, RNA-dependent DNA polymerase [Tanacetum coccineum]